jgi:hypothetical protein
MYGSTTARYDIVYNTDVQQTLTLDTTRIAKSNGVKVIYGDCLFSIKITAAIEAYHPPNVTLFNTLVSLTRL